MQVPTAPGQRRRVAEKAGESVREGRPELFEQSCSTGGTTTDCQEPGCGVSYLDLDVTDGVAAAQRALRTRPGAASAAGGKTG